MQFKGLNLNTREKLNVVTDMIYESAIDGPKFATLYANLCKHIALVRFFLIIYM